MNEASISEAHFSIVVRRLCKSFGSLSAVDNVSFRIQKGEILGFLGPNGAGKSTTMRILSGLMAATSGNAYICGISVANDPNRARAHIGYMPENNPLPEDVRVVEYLRFRARIKGVPHRDIRKSVDEAMEVCRIQKKASRKIIGNLSKGFKQRVGIADALLGKPDIIIMDEPTIGLDPHQIISIRELIRSLKGKMSVIISSHILPEIEQVCDRVMIINHGRVVASGSPENLRKEFVPSASYSISLKASPDEVAAKLSAFPQKLTVESASPPDKDGFVSYILKTDSTENLGEVLIGEFSKDSNMRLREVRSLIPSLEDIFMLATRASWEDSSLNVKDDANV